MFLFTWAIVFQQQQHTVEIQENQMPDCQSFIKCHPNTSIIDSVFLSYYLKRCWGFLKP